jgi:hypothetical protein
MRRWDDDAQKFLPADFVKVNAALRFEGSSKFDECYALAKELLEIGKHPCFIGEWPSKECGMLGQVIPKPPAKRKFLAVSSLWHLKEFLMPLLKATGVKEAPWPLSVWRDSIKTVCEKSYDEILAHNKLLSSPMPEKYLSCYCALGAYVYTLLRDGYGFEMDSEQMYPVKTIREKEFDIGFGFVLKHANDLPWRLSEQQQRDSSESIGMFAAWMSFLGAVLGGILIVLVHPAVERYLGLAIPRSSGRPSSKGTSEHGVELAERFRPLKYSDADTVSAQNSFDVQTQNGASTSARESFSDVQIIY